MRSLECCCFINPTMTQELVDPPIRSSLLLALTTQSALLQELFSSLPSGGHDAPTLHAALVQSSATLDGLAAQAEDHQRKWRELSIQKQQVADLESRIKLLVRELESGCGELESMVDEGHKLAESIDQSEICESPLSGCIDDSTDQRAHPACACARALTHHLGARFLPPLRRGQGNGDPLAKPDRYSLGTAVPA